MRQYMPGDTGWTEMGPRKDDRVHAEPKEIAEVIRQGKDTPRALDLEDARRAAENRREVTSVLQQREAEYKSHGV